MNPVYFGKLSRFTNPSKFLEIEDIKLRNQLDLNDAILKGNHIRAILDRNPVIHEIHEVKL